MKKLLVAIGIIGGGVVLFLLLRSPEPRYQGRSITELQDEWAAKRLNGFHIENGFQEALQHLGANALPYVVANLALNDSAWRSNYGRLQARMPIPLQRLFRKPKPLLQVGDGAIIFHSLGSNSIPCAIGLLRHPSPTVRQAVAWGIAAISGQSAATTNAIPTLTQCLGDPEGMVRFYTVIALAQMGPDASNAVPALTKILETGLSPPTSSLFYLQAIAAFALGKIGPAASSALPDLRAAARIAFPYLQGQAAVAIWRIDADVDMALPILLQEMPGIDEDSKSDWIIALGEMGPRAKQALPQLTNELANARYEWVRKLAAKAINSIGTEAATEGGVK